jgi:hypothetical protein
MNILSHVVVIEPSAFTSEITISAFLKCSGRAPQAISSLVLKLKMF